MAAPSATTVANQATAMNFRTDTPGLNSVIQAWGVLLDFTDGWARGAINNQVYVQNLFQGLQT